MSLSRFFYLVWSGFARSGLKGVAIAVMSIMAFVPMGVASITINVTNDNGGSLTARVGEIRRIRRLGQVVEIHEGYCNSACTLYLGLPKTCVSPTAQFGFHGPQIATHGLVMLPSQFEYWSQLMADHYPKPIRDWFMRVARHSTDLIMIKGDLLIALGVSQCA